MKTIKPHTIARVKEMCNLIHTELVTQWQLYRQYEINYGTLRLDLEQRVYKVFPDITRNEVLELRRTLRANDLIDLLLKFMTNQTSWTGELTLLRRALGPIAQDTYAQDLSFEDFDRFMDLYNWLFNNYAFGERLTLAMRTTSKYGLTVTTHFVHPHKRIVTITKP